MSSTRHHYELTPLRRPTKSGPHWDRIALVVAVPTMLVVAVVVLMTGGDSTTPVTAGADTMTSVPTATQAPSTTARPVADLAGCHLNQADIALGDTGDDVVCAQKALFNGGFYDGEFTGEFDTATAVAVEYFQDVNNLYVDGIVGGNTADALGIWPGDEWFIVRTPAPAAGATDLLGFELSPVASVGDDAPAMPPDSGQGTGKRIVYSRAGQRVWAIDDDERVVRSYLVTGSQYNNELPGVHKIYSKSEMSTAWDFQANLPLMVRWLDTERGAIGFHQIPVGQDGQPYQTIDELGTSGSGGCQRQAPQDAVFMWNFGTIGTPVWVT